MNFKMKCWFVLFEVLLTMVQMKTAVVTESYSCLCTLSPVTNSTLFWNLDESNRLIVSTEALTFNLSSPSIEKLANSWSIEALQSSNNLPLYLMINHLFELEVTHYLPGSTESHFTYSIERGSIPNTYKFISGDLFHYKKEIHWFRSTSSDILTVEYPGSTFDANDFLFNIDPFDDSSSGCAALMKQKRSCSAKLKSPSNELFAYLFANINHFDNYGSVFKLISPSLDSNYNSWSFQLLDNSTSRDLYLRANTNEDVYLEEYPISADKEFFSFHPFFDDAFPGKIGFNLVKSGYENYSLAVFESKTATKLKLLPGANVDPKKYLFQLEDFIGETQCSFYFPTLRGSNGKQKVNSTVPAGVIGPSCTLVPGWANVSDHNNVKKATINLKSSIACLRNNKSVVYLQKLFKSRVAMVDLVMAQNVTAHDDDEFSTMDMATGLEELGEHIAFQLPVNTSMDVKLPLVVMEIAKQPTEMRQYKFPKDESKEETHIIVEGDIFSQQEPNSIVGAIYEHLEEERHSVNVGHEGLLKQGRYAIDSKIISASVGGSRQFHMQNSVNVTILLKHIQSRPDKRFCAFWQATSRSLSGSTNGFWSTKGCWLIKTNDSHTTCHCNHLTHFGILMELGNGARGLDQMILEAITKIGSILSLVALIIGIIILTIILCGHTHFNERFVIHLNLLIALALAQLLFISAIDANGNQDICRIVAYSIHFLYLACFTWMLVEGVHLYLMVVKVFETGRSKIAYYILFAWGIPLVVVMVTVGITGDSYRATDYCWLAKHHGVIWSFVAPVIGILVINTIITILVMREIMKLSSVRQTSNLAKARAGLRSVVLLLPLFGLTWLFGLLTFTNGMRIFQYLFTIFNTLQGFFVVLFHVALNSEVRKALLSRKRIFWTSYSDYFRKPSFTTTPRKPSSLSQASQNTLDSRTNLDVTNLSTPLKQYPS